ncbi:MAG: lipid-A-disaccharide synthase [Betaproteobacteria bacterium]|nr:lipid-A-disaccharide synthase [Betaproteobacteria bacterium]
MSMRIALVAGEASGDLLGARLISALKQHLPDAQFFGIGGPQMESEGFEAWFSSERLAVNGFADALRRLPELLKIRRNVIARVKQEKAHLFIGIDAPDFNLGLEKRLKRAGLPTVHYVSPSIWAWRGGRAKKIRKAADLVLCLFPCEPELYAKYAMPAQFVGHPLADEFPLAIDRNLVREHLRLPLAAPIVTLMPGSRNGEVTKLATTFVQAAMQIAQRKPGVRFLVPLITRETRKLFEAARYQELGNQTEPEIQLMVGHSHEAMAAADVVLLASGTAALEAALLKRPMVVAYRIANWSYRLLRRMMYLPYVSLPNILCREFVVPELIQDDCTPEKLADAVCRWLDDTEARQKLEARFLSLHQELKQNNAQRAADAILGLLKGIPR